jgi:hypothetical protein
MSLSLRLPIALRTVLNVYQRFQTNVFGLNKKKITIIRTRDASLQSVNFATSVISCFLNFTSKVGVGRVDCERTTVCRSCIRCLKLTSLFILRCLCFSRPPRFIRDESLMNLGGRGVFKYCVD